LSTAVFTQPMNILIADDHAIVRAGLIYVIKNHMAVSSIFEAGDLDGVEAVLMAQDVDLIICDINMPGFDTTAVITTIKALAPAIRILMFSAYNEDLYGWRYLKAGAHGYLHKERGEEEMVRAIQMVVTNRIYVSQDLQQHLLIDKTGNQTSPIDNLSARELDIARLLIKGKGLKEISALLDIHVSSVSTYKRRVFEKLMIDNVADLITILGATAMKT